MKIEFEIDENEQRNFASRLIRREDAFMLLWELDNLCREKIKYGCGDIKTPEDAFQIIRDEILETNLLYLWD